MLETTDEAAGALGAGTRGSVGRRIPVIVKEARALVLSFGEMALPRPLDVIPAGDD